MDGEHMEGEEQNGNDGSDAITKPVSRKPLLTDAEVSEELGIPIKNLVIPENLRGRKIEKEDFYDFVKKKDGKIPDPPSNERVEAKYRLLEKNLEKYSTVKGKRLRNHGFYGETIGEDRLSNQQISFLIRPVGKDHAFYYVHKGKDVFERITRERYNEIKKERTLQVNK